MKIDQVLNSDPEIVSGAVVFAGTRVPVDALFGNLASGLSLDEFLEEFPTVEREQAIAALHLASEHIKSFYRWQNFESAA
ncbi:DUF433 domain-containing protein [Jiella marina]|uniref:DUF433 domain-containing protein n=1 Tax=Jiella sp. LLJ827 TaxID=2917712 RepID=UPI0021013B2D|nr:DUF433 domain-containing protein [Jiella sp. LLJ827]MCQ0987250.1 DUF433 domain-containing protein [Jiella sp. LLJ827]